MIFNRTLLLAIFTFILLNIIMGKVLEDIPKHSQECTDLLEEFASASARFMFCTVTNARPVHICCSCENVYNEVAEKHEQIIKAKKKQNSSCDESLINQDRLEVIESGYSYIQSLWLKGQCKNCFDGKNSRSNTTKDFLSLYSTLNNCLDEHYNPTNKTYSTDVCFLCSDEYYKMTNFYAALKKKMGNGNVCMDIVDSVNVTQHLWSNVLHCGETLMTFETPLILITLLVSVLPIVFYLCARKFTRNTSSAVLNQNRLSQRLRERWRSRTGSSVSRQTQS